MYTPPMFQPDRSASLAFAKARGFGTMCAFDGNGPVASPLPFCIDYAEDGTPRVAFHVARGNPLIRLAGGKTPWMLAVNGADAYVSADWYVSPDQVPTWLYQAVHLSGPVQTMGKEALAGHLDELSAKFEGWLGPKPPWTTAKMTAARLHALRKMIVGLVMTVEDIQGSFKLNQHKSDVDYAAIAQSLARQDDPAAQAIGKQMVALRPQLDYNLPAAGSELADGRNAS